jgi:outer membrane protein assembly factor BamB
MLVRGDGVLEARAVADGSVRWTALSPETFQTAPFVVNDVVYAVTGSGLLLGFDVATGREVWRHRGTTPFGSGSNAFALP